MSHCKGALKAGKQYIKADDVPTATDLRDAILSNNGVRGVRVAVVNVEGVRQMQPAK